ncbi:unnamed protein product [Rhizophagus irregularis]|nr:unnamed protein product [Rhizophagus irregularis]
MASFYFLMLLYLSFLHLLFTTITIWVIMNLCPLTTLSVSFLEFPENVQYLKNMDNSPELIKKILENPALDVQRVEGNSRFKGPLKISTNPNKITNR